MLSLYYCLQGFWGTQFLRVEMDLYYIMYSNT